VARIGIITGIAAEAGCIPRNTRECFVRTGIGYDMARKNAEYCIADNTDGLISFGVAGGLSDTLGCGDVVLATLVGSGDRVFETDTRWRDALFEKLNNDLPLSTGDVTHVDDIIADPLGKQALYHKTGAVVCDMESLAVAEVAAENKVPFLIVRAVSDPVDAGVPPWVSKILDDQGRVKKMKITRQILKNPVAVADLWRLGRNANTAFKSLARVSKSAGPGFALPV